MATSKLLGDWSKAGIILRKLPASISPMAHARLYAQGEEVAKRLVEHIELQDLRWQPLSRATIERKGDSTIYVDTGWLKENLSVRRIATKPLRSTIFIGASPWKTHKPSGMKFSDLMVMLEYGTDDIPARPLIRPTWEEVRKELEKDWKNFMKDLVKTGGWT